VTTNARRWLLAALVVVSGVGLDQATKQLAEAKLRAVGIVSVVEGFFELRYSRNTGAFFSLGESVPDGPRRIGFVVLTLAAIGLMTHLYRKAAESQKLLRWALVLLCTGAIGDLIDRVLYGEVIDFLHLHVREIFHWATFNVADIYIAGGLVLLVWDLVRAPRGKAKEPR
jgi:signal peptidase II